MPNSSAQEWEINGRSIRVTSLDKPYWPEDGFTKGDTLDYYRRVAKVILRYIHNRPVTLRAYPNGINGPGFWRRDRPDSAPDWLGSVTYEPETTRESIDVPVINDEASLVWYVDHSAIEIHQWMSQLNHLTRPDFAVFDLDPGKTVDFAEILEAALHVRDELTGNELQSFAKTSGAAGLHVFVPIAQRYSFDQIREWVHTVARKLAVRFPESIAAASGGTHRGSVVTIDHAQNSIARNTAAPYTLRARPGAPVSMPISWREVEQGEVRPEQFTLHTVPDRLEREGDAWTNALELHQRIPDLG